MLFKKGVEDINNKIIKSVDLPEKIFEQSESRFFRLIRFKINFGFDISVDVEAFVLSQDFKNVYVS